MAINLQKGQRINLEKTNGSKLQNICVGINWGAIEKKGMFGFGTSKEAVDLDASCALYDDNKKMTDIIYFGNLKSKDGAVKHSGDDQSGEEIRPEPAEERPLGSEVSVVSRDFERKFRTSHDTGLIA